MHVSAPGGQAWVRSAGRGLWTAGVRRPEGVQAPPRQQRHTQDAPPQPSDSPSLWSSAPLEAPSHPGRPPAQWSKVGGLRREQGHTLVPHPVLAKLGPLQTSVLKPQPRCPPASLSAQCPSTPWSLGWALPVCSRLSVRPSSGKGAGVGHDPTGSLRQWVQGGGVGGKS